MNLRIPRVVTSKFYKSFVYNVITLWNDIPLSFRADTTLKKFKKYLREVHLQTENLPANIRALDAYCTFKYRMRSYI